MSYSGYVKGSTEKIAFARYEHITITLKQDHAVMWLQDEYHPKKQKRIILKLCAKPSLLFFGHAAPRPQIPDLDEAYNRQQHPHVLEQNAIRFIYSSSSAGSLLIMEKYRSS